MKNERLTISHLLSKTQEIMSTLRLPLIGDFVYVSRLVTPEIEQKYVVTGKAEDGYYIVPEGMDPKNNTSMIKYKFLSEKWVVHKAENEFNIRIQLNPDLYDPPDLFDDMNLILELIRDGTLNQAEELLDRYRSTSDLSVLTRLNNSEETPYRAFIQSPYIVEILNWLKRNYMVNYMQLLNDAIVEMLSDNPDEVSPDVLMWLLDQNIEWSKYYDNQDFDNVTTVIYRDVLGDDRIDIFKWVVRIPGLMDAAKELHDRSFIEGAEIDEATKILELLRTVPSKAVQVKHL